MNERRARRGSSAPAPATLFTARTVLVGADAPTLGGGGLLVAGGRVERVLQGPAAVRRARARAARAVDLGDGCLAPGLVDAHAHLELTDLAGIEPPPGPERPGDFTAWVASVLARRLAVAADGGRASVLRGAERALAGGTTAVGDVDSLGHGGAPLARAGPRVRLYREVLDARDPARTEAAWSAARRALPRRARVHEGLSPHAPFTVSDELLARAARARRRRSVPLAMHWAESLDEARWSAGERGPLAELVGPPPRVPILERLEALGLLGPFTSLVHGNHAEGAERRLLGERGVWIVHCPGSHAFFGRAPFDLAAWRRAGARVVLGTDSLASNAALDMTREMALLRAAHPEEDPRAVLRMATADAAAALGFAPLAGTLAPGAWADFAVHGGPAGEVEGDVVDALTSGALRVRETWVAGRRVWRA